MTMITDKQDKKISRFLSKILRHRPELIGITLDAAGWVEVAVLLEALSKSPYPISKSKLVHIVETNDKQRFAFDQTKQKIRASQGHSICVDLDLSPQIPPKLVYHGTSLRALEKILQEGISKQARQYVHLSQDIHTATKVGRRHGRPVVLVVAAETMVQDGHAFYLSDNGVWLTDGVPSTYLQVFEGILV